MAKETMLKTMLNEKVVIQSTKIVSEIENLMNSNYNLEELTTSAIAILSVKIAELQHELENLKCYVYKD
jgi:hypothetical protein